MDRYCKHGHFILDFTVTVNQINLDLFFERSQ